MSKPILVMVHGRAQGGKDPDALRQTWLDTWAKGLSAERAKRLSEIEVRFPFYADELDAMAATADLDEAGIAARGPSGQIDPEFAAFRAAIAEAALADAGLREQLLAEQVAQHRGPLQWDWVQRIFQKLESVPGLSGTMLERFIRDVWIYLKYPPVRRKINGIVEAMLPPDGKLVMLGHSLGSVVAYDVLSKARGIEVPLFMTVGSPLGVKQIVELLKPIGFPAVAAHWFNGYDERDVVALRPLDAANFKVNPAVENYGKVRNGTDNAHGIIGYLNNDTVANRLFEALLG